MQSYFDNHDNSSDPLDYLVLCPLDDLKVLDHNEFTEKLEDDSDSESEMSIDANDLKEWFEDILSDESNEKKVEKESVPTSIVAFPENPKKDKHQGETLEVNCFQEKLDAMRGKAQIASKDQPDKETWYQDKSDLSERNQDTTVQSHHIIASKDQLINYDSFHEKIELLGNNLEKSMQKTQISHDLFLKNKNEPQQASTMMDLIGKQLETTMQRTQMTSELFFKKNKAEKISLDCISLKKLTDLANGRRKYLTIALEESWKHMASFNFAHRFNRGKRKNLTEKIRESQNRLQILRSQSEILTREKVVTKKRRSLNELENPNPPKLAQPKSDYARSA